MKKQITLIMILTGLLGFFGCSSDPSTWNDKQINKWFDKGEWLNSLNIKPDGSINKKEFAISYFKNKERWDKAFMFMKNNDLSKLEPKRHDIDGNNLYALVSEYLSKNEDSARFEAHKKYIDIQYVISGIEQMAVAPLSMKKEVITPYDETKDIEFMTVSESTSYKATPDRFFLFFPSDIHRPGVRVNENSQIKKLVLKVKTD